MCRRGEENGRREEGGEREGRREIYYILVLYTYFCWVLSKERS